MSDETNSTAPASPFAQPASPFAAPATTAEAPAATSAPVEMGDTDFLDTVSAREPLVKPCTVPGVILTLEPKQNETSGKQSVFIAVQVYGDKMVFDNGSPVSPGKRLVSTLYVPLDTPEKKERSERKLKALYLALRNVPLDGKEIAIYASWPREQKLGFLAPDEAKRRPLPLWSFHGIQPASQWEGTRVMVQITSGKDMDGNPRNEFTLLAASTKPIERKGRA